MTMQCSCGHTVDHMEETYTLSIADYNEYGNPCVMYVNYCKKCADRAEEDGVVLKTLEEEDLWLNPKPIGSDFVGNAIQKHFGVEE